jgi:hypothetical protein
MALHMLIHHLKIIRYSADIANHSPVIVSQSLPIIASLIVTVRRWSRNHIPINYSTSTFNLYPTGISTYFPHPTENYTLTLYLELTYPYGTIVPSLTLKIKQVETGRINTSGVKCAFLFVHIGLIYWARYYISLAYGGAAASATAIIPSPRPLSASSLACVALSTYLFSWLSFLMLLSLSSLLVVLSFCLWPVWCVRGW